MAKGNLPYNLKGAQVTMETGVNTEDTQMLDGEASDMQFLNESNKTVQYKTSSLPKGDLGGRNNLDG